MHCLLSAYTNSNENYANVSVQEKQPHKKNDHRNVSNISRPHLVGAINVESSEQVRVDLVFFHSPDSNCALGKWFLSHGH